MKTTRYEAQIGDACAAVTLEVDATGADVVIAAGAVRGSFRIREGELRRLARTLREAVAIIEAEQAADAVARDASNLAEPSTREENTTTRISHD